MVPKEPPFLFVSHIFLLDAGEAKLIRCYNRIFAAGSFTMTNWAPVLNIIGRFLLAFYFLKAGINNTYNWKKVLGLIKAKKIPFPHLVLLAVVTTQILGALAIIFNYYTLIAAIALIIFTLAANFLICNYWKMEGVQRRNVSFVFYANLAIIGALLLIGTTTFKI